MAFEPDLGPLFRGDMQAVVLDPHGQQPTTIVSLKDDFHLKVSWQLYGPLVPLMAGKWKVQAFLESIGPGPEPTLFLGEYAMGNTNYSCEQPIYPKSLLLTPGVYKLVTVITAVDSLNRPAPFAAYVEGPMLQFYEGESL